MGFSLALPPPLSLPLHERCDSIQIPSKPDIATSEQEADVENDVSGAAKQSQQSLLALPPSEKCCSHAGLSNDITWKDSFYDSRRSVIAVFDTDTAVLRSLHRSTLIKFLMYGTWIAAISVLWEVFSQKWLYVVYVAIATFIYASALRTYHKLRAVEEGNIHFAVTKLALLYDQRVPFVRHMTPLRTITACEAEQVTFRKWGIFGETLQISRVTIRSSGIERKYLGIRNVDGLQQIIAILQDNPDMKKPTPSIYTGVLVDKPMV